MFLKSSRLLKWHRGEAWPGDDETSQGRKGWFCALRKISWNVPLWFRQGKSLSGSADVLRHHRALKLCSDLQAWSPLTSTSPEPLLKPSFLETPPSLPCPPCSVHGPLPLPAHTSPGHHARCPCPHLHRQAPSTSACPPPPLASPQTVSVAPHTKTHSAASPSETDNIGVFSGEWHASHHLLTVQPEVQRPLLTAPSPLPLSPHLRPCFWFPQCPSALFSSTTTTQSRPPLPFPGTAAKTSQMSLKSSQTPPVFSLLSETLILRPERPSQMPVWSHDSCVPPSTSNSPWLTCPKASKGCSLPTSFWPPSTLLFTLHLKPQDSFSFSNVYLSSPLPQRFTSSKKPSLIPQVCRVPRCSYNERQNTGIHTAVLITDLTCMFIWAVSSSVLWHVHEGKTIPYNLHFLSIHYTGLAYNRDKIFQRHKSV